MIDTHAGEGAYDLASDEAERTGEWRGGVGRLGGLAGMDPRQAELLKPYLDCVGPFVDGRPALYPGSPLLTQRLMRANDRAIFCELRDDAFDAFEREATAALFAAGAATPERFGRLLDAYARMFGVAV